MPCKTIKILMLLLILIILSICERTQAETILLDDFEGAITGGVEGTVDFGAGNGSSVAVCASSDIKQSGNQSLKITYQAVEGGYMWVARGFQLDAKNAVWLVKPETIHWEKFKGISFYMYGMNSLVDVAFDIKDNGGEIWRYKITDEFTGWRKITCYWDEFFARNDWQPDNANKNRILDFPLKSFQFEVLTPAEGVLYFDRVELVD
ncbi:MAG: hypothetical protein N2606_04615 [Candidatus Omnitrophica bacterium]|nr:hypothetical protein [Candidatus Omnitrophota bacterium]